jgi:hypothetical protein
MKDLKGRALMEPGINVVWDDVELANEGLHNCTVLSVDDLGNQTGEFGTAGRTVRITYRIDDQDTVHGLPIEVRDQYSVERFNPRTKLGKLLIEAGLQFARRERFDLKKLVGKKLLVVIEQREDPVTKRTYANIVRVIKPQHGGVK